MDITLDWLGVSTFRVVIDDLVIFLDAYMDRVPEAPPVGLGSADVDRADFVEVDSLNGCPVDLGFRFGQTCKDGESPVFDILTQ